MPLRIRTFADSDYEAITAVQNAAHTGFGPAETVAQIRFHDEHRPSHCMLYRIVAEVDGDVVGWGQYQHIANAYHPDTYWAKLCVHPDYRRRGIGSAIYDDLAHHMVAADALRTYIGVREDMADSLRFLARRGLEEKYRSWESWLDVTTFDAEAFADDRRCVAEQGIAINTYPELADDPDRDRKLYELGREFSADMPRSEPYTGVSFEVFVEAFLGSPGFIDEATFVALDGDQYVGFSNLMECPTADVLNTCDTGVARAYRRRGIATALKLCAIDYARRVGVPAIRTWNESTNRGMLAINERLGFAKKPAWINFVKHFREA